MHAELSPPPEKPKTLKLSVPLAQSLKVEKANLEHRVKQLEADAHDAEEELKLLRQQLASAEKVRVCVGLLSPTPQPKRVGC